MLFDKVLEKILKNQELKKGGGHIAPPFPFKRLADYYPVIDKGHSIGILAGTGVGKSTLLRYMFIYYLYEFYKKTGYKTRIFYFPLEDNKEKVYLYFICNYLHREKGIKISMQELTSKGERELPDFIVDYIKEAREYFAEFEQIVTVVDGYTEPKQIYKILESYALKTGVINEYTVNIEGKGEEKQLIYESDTHTFVLIDNMANIDQGKEHDSERAAMVELAKIYIRERLCNFFKFTCILLLQNDFATERAQFSTNGKPIMSKVEPSLASIGEAKTVARSMHVIFSLFDPSKYDFIRYPAVSEENAEKAYDLDILGNKFRAFRILKNNEGENGVRIGLLMNPWTGEFEELPPPDSPEMKQVYQEFKQQKMKTVKSKGAIIFEEDYLEEAPF